MTPGQTFPTPGAAQELEPGVRCILAPNPSPMTLHGTNTYLLGNTDLAVIDPGPENSAHLAAILGAARGAKISAILVTHSHLDHSPLARSLAAETGAPVMAFGNSTAGRSAHMQAIAESGLAGGGEGVDPDFHPDIALADGQEISGDSWVLKALWTPGHFCNHMCFAAGDLVFTGDHVMGWASSMVSPPDGDLTAFMTSCARLAKRDDRVFYPGHGAPVHDPRERLSWLIAHRRRREAQILRALNSGPASATALAAEIYTEIPANLLPAARRNVLAHLIDLHIRKKVDSTGALSEHSEFALI